ncbi:MAG TPA: hypothetical protein VJT15_16990 [Pyrinomonadaceae bacterium]|nr:hypothetical protein [Pyrinomonadaceae bacterium]
MYPRGGFSTELWVELMWSFVWILMIPVAVTLILLMLTVLAEVVGRATEQPQRTNKDSTVL